MVGRLRNKFEKYFTEFANELNVTSEEKGESKDDFHEFSQYYRVLLSMYSFQITYNIFYARDIDNKL